MSEAPSPLGENVAGAAVGKPTVRSTTMGTPRRATLPAASRRSMSNRYRPSAAATRAEPEVTRPSQETLYSCAFRARQPWSQRTTSPAESMMPTRMLHASAGL